MPERRRERPCPVRRHSLGSPLRSTADSGRGTAQPKRRQHGFAALARRSIPRTARKNESQAREYSWRPWVKRSDERRSPSAYRAASSRDSWVRTPRAFLEGRENSLDTSQHRPNPAAGTAESARAGGRLVEQRPERIPQTMAKTAGYVGRTRALGKYMRHCPGRGFLRFRRATFLQGYPCPNSRTRPNRGRTSHYHG